MTVILPLSRMIIIINTALLEACKAHNLGVIFELSYFLRWNDLENLASNITYLRNFDSIIAWYIVDESLEYLRMVRELLKMTSKLHL